MIKFIPHPVVTGFTAGIAVIIASSQVKDFLGLAIAEVPAELVPKWQAYWGAMASTSWGTLGVGAGSLAVIILLRKFAPQLRSEEHTSELQSLLRYSYAVFCLKQRK